MMKAHNNNKDKHLNTIIHSKYIAEAKMKQGKTDNFLNLTLYLYLPVVLFGDVDDREDDLHSA